MCVCMLQFIKIKICLNQTKVSCYIDLSSNESLLDVSFEVASESHLYKILYIVILFNVLKFIQIK